MIYLDNSASSWPKPSSVLNSVNEFLKKSAGNPSRSGHSLSIDAGRIVFECRNKLADFFGITNPLNVVFTHNATHAINIIINSYGNSKSKFVTTAIEHNAVIRPLRELEKNGSIIKIATLDNNNNLDLEKFSKLITKNTSLVVVNHASNVNGMLMPIKEISAITRTKKVPLLVDVSQTAGLIDINMNKDGIDIIAFTGHKSLMGPTGTGGLIFSDDFDALSIQNLYSGGTGSASELETQPNIMPDKFESGTLNGVGIAGLSAAISFLNKEGISKILDHEKTIISYIINEIKDIKGIRILSAINTNASVPIFSFSFLDKDVAEISFRLDSEFNIQTRAGLHCAPLAHKAFDSFKTGTVRISPGYFTTLKNAKYFVKSLKTILA